MANRRCESGNRSLTVAALIGAPTVREGLSDIRRRPSYTRMHKAEPYASRP
jgi:hypothetical protein